MAIMVALLADESQSLNSLRRRVRISTQVGRHLPDISWASIEVPIQRNSSLFSLIHGLKGD
ncbi:hypothetical protein [Novosphingobium sp. EMRT-2]|uniref:hypothetical protein n=1 Tax=Novosphingobium sp. EMRT-2 TaxID=2571749 RepID=UPI0010BD02E9|nr:hypothetical protein [Novosphingobium sp. EMRT-2]QCI95048.1 hypothetical protein FA702_17015 [Novosphingobium sp. EMRT-2]